MWRSQQKGTYHFKQIHDNFLGRYNLWWWVALWANQILIYGVRCHWRIERSVNIQKGLPSSLSHILCYKIGAGDSVALYSLLEVPNTLSDICGWLKLVSGAKYQLLKSIAYTLLMLLQNWKVILLWTRCYCKITLCYWDNSRSIRTSVGLMNMIDMGITLGDRLRYCTRSGVIEEL